MDNSSDHQPVSKARKKKSKEFRNRKLSSSRTDTPQQAITGQPPDEQHAKKSTKKKRPPPNTTPTDEETATEDINIRNPPPPRDIRTLKGKSEKIDAALLTFLSSPSNSVLAEVLAYVMAKTAKLQGLLNESLLRNSHLEGQLTSLQHENQGQRKTFAAAAKRKPTATTSQPLT